MITAIEVSNNYSPKDKYTVLSNNYCTVSIKKRKFYGCENVR